MQEGGIKKEEARTRREGGYKTCGENVFYTTPDSDNLVD